jgi:hypothetical protein
MNLAGAQKLWIFEIPCAVVGRFAKILTIMTHDANEWFNSIRIDNGLALASNRTILACEQIGGGGGVVHIKNDPALIAQCEKEAPFDSVLYVTLNEAIAVRFGQNHARLYLSR